MKRGLIVLALVLALAGAAGSATAAKPPAGWNHTHYFEFSELSLGTVTDDPTYTHPDCAWQGGPKYVTNVSPPDFLPFNCVNAAYVWATNCRPGAQTVEFKKRIWLPGKASEFSASLVAIDEGKMQWMEIKVNGQSVMNVTRSVHKRDLDAGGPAFKYGWNVIEVRARKGVTGPCGSNPTVGVYAHLHAKFAADIAVVIPRKASGTFIVPISVINKGPSAAPEVSFSFAAYTTRLKKSHGFVMLVRRDGGDPLGGCSTSAASTGYNGESFTGYRTTCLLGELKPGERLNLEVIYNYVAPSGDFFDRWPIIWRADSTEVTDGKHGNNGGDRWQGACRPAKPPQCSAPTG